MGRDPKLLETGDLVPRLGFQLDSVECQTAPECKRLAQQPGGLAHVSHRDLLACIRDELREPRRVQPRRFDLDGVAGRPRLDRIVPVARERLA